MSADVLQRPEVPNTEIVLKRVRHELGQSHGLDVSEEATQLEAGQTTTPDEFGGSRAELMKEATEKLGGKEALSAGVEKRYNVHAQAKLRSANPGEPVQLMNPLPMYTNPDEGEKAATALVRRMSVEDAATGVGIDAAQLEQYMQGASVNVYNSPQNGAPVITERVIELPNMTLHEMNVHSAGSPEVIDAQVVAIKK